MTTQDKELRGLICELEAASILLRRACSELRRLEAENEAKDRLLEQVRNRALAIIEAPKDTWSDGKAVREMLREATHINAAIAQHLKGTP